MIRNAGSILLLSFLFAMLSAFGRNKDPEPLLDSAAKAYDNEKYERSLELYRKVARSYRSPSLYYNMGNAAFRAGDLGHAILYYRKAEKKAPWDEDIQHALSIAKEKTRDDFKSKAGKGLNAAFKDFLVASPLGDWWVWSMASSSLAGATLILLTFIPRNRRSIAWSFLSLFLFITLIFYGADMGKRAIMGHKQNGVIIAPSAQVLSEPRANASIAFVLHEGTTLKVLEKKERRVEIKTPDDQVGWISKKEISLF
ncbi:MAG: tetratricopeptide repeat protein [Flavobacteriales bacterium]